jgi:hypothetical protein
MKISKFYITYILVHRARRNRRVVRGLQTCGNCTVCRLPYSNRILPVLVLSSVFDFRLNNSAPARVVFGYTDGNSTKSNVVLDLKVGVANGSFIDRSESGRRLMLAGFSGYKDLDL